MALIRCSECGNLVSDKAVACPRCGKPINYAPSNTGQPPRGNNNGWIYALIGALAVIAVILIFLLFGPKSCVGGSRDNFDGSPSFVVDSTVVDTAFSSIDTTKIEVNEEPVVEKPRGRTMYFLVVASTTSLAEAKRKVDDIGGGMVVKGFAKGATRYRVCIEGYYSKREARENLDYTMSWTDNGWVLTDNEDSIVYRR